MADDSPMVHLVDSEEIVSEFLDAGVSIADQKVIDQLKKLSVEYNLTPADLYAQWLSYTNKNPGVEKLDANVVEELEARIHQSRIKSTQHSSMKAKYILKAKPKIEFDILETYSALVNVKKEPIDFEVVDQQDNPILNNDQPSLEAKLEPIEIKHEPIKIKQEPVDVDEQIKCETDEDDHLYKKEIIAEFGPVIPFKAWLSIKVNRNFKITPFDHTRNLLSEEKFMDISIRKNVIAMQNIYNELRHKFLASSSSDEWPLCEKWNEPPTSVARFFGGLRMDSKDEFNERLVCLYDGCDNKVRFQLDFAHVEDFSIFPGQFVEIIGEAVNRETLRVKEVFDPMYLMNPFPPLPRLANPLNIVTSSGPFNQPNSDDFSPLKNLLEYVGNYRPDVLILFGPIVEFTPAMFDHFSFSLFNDAMCMISDKASETGTRVIVISSPKEWHTLSVFPTPPYNGCWTNIELFAGPSVVDINGLTIGVSSVDIILHLTKHLMEGRKTSGNRIKRILKHILVQNSFYPLYPPADEVTLEVPKMDYCRFERTPHLIILPSTLRNFIYSIEGCVFINPERARKNLIGRIQVSPIANHGTPSNDKIAEGNIDSFISAQIIKV